MALRVLRTGSSKDVMGGSVVGSPHDIQSRHIVYRVSLFKNSKRLLCLTQQGIDILSPFSTANRELISYSDVTSISCSEKHVLEFTISTAKGATAYTCRDRVTLVTMLLYAVELASTERNSVGSSSFPSFSLLKLRKHDERPSEVTMEVRSTFIEIIKKQESDTRADGAMKALIPIHNILFVGKTIGQPPGLHLQLRNGHFHRYMHHDTTLRDQIVSTIAANAKNYLGLAIDVVEMPDAIISVSKDILKNANVLFICSADKPLQNGSTVPRTLIVTSDGILEQDPETEVLLSHHKMESIVFVVRHYEPRVLSIEYRNDHVYRYICDHREILISNICYPNYLKGRYLPVTACESPLAQKVVSWGEDNDTDYEDYILKRLVEVPRDDQAGIARILLDLFVNCTVSIHTGPEKLQGLLNHIRILVAQLDALGSGNTPSSNRNLPTELPLDTQLIVALQALFRMLQCKHYFREVSHHQDALANIVKLLESPNVHICYWAAIVIKTMIQATFNDKPDKKGESANKKILFGELNGIQVATRQLRALQRGAFRLTDDLCLAVAALLAILESALSARRSTTDSDLVKDATFQLSRILPTLFAFTRSASLEVTSLASKLIIMVLKSTTQANAITSIQDQALQECALLSQMLLALSSRCQIQKLLACHTIAKLSHHHSMTSNVLGRMFPTELFALADAHFKGCANWSKTEWDKFFVLLDNDLDTVLVQWNDVCRAEAIEAIKNEIAFFEHEKTERPREVLIWNHEEFSIPYSYLQGRLKVGRYYVKSLFVYEQPTPLPPKTPKQPKLNLFKLDSIEAVTDNKETVDETDVQQDVLVLKEPLGDPVLFWQELVISFATDRETADQMFLLEVMCLVYEKHCDSIGPLRNMGWLVSLLRDDRRCQLAVLLLNLIRKACTAPTTGNENVRLFLAVGGLPVLIAILASLHRFSSADVDHAYSRRQLGVACLSMMRRLVSFHSSIDENGHVRSPMPIAKRMLSERENLLHVIQALLLDDDQLRKETVLLLHLILSHSPKVIESTCDMGLFEFLLLYHGAGLETITALLEKLHIQPQPLQDLTLCDDDVAVAATGGDSVTRSVLLRFFPPAVVIKLVREGSFAFAALLSGDTDTPEVIWNPSMKSYLISQLKEHVAPFVAQLRNTAVGTVTPSYTQPFKGPVNYPDLRDEIRCSYIYLRNFVDMDRFPEWRIDHPGQFIVMLNKLLNRHAEDFLLTGPQLLYLLEAHLVVLNRYSSLPACMNYEGYPALLSILSRWVFGTQFTPMDIEIAIRIATLIQVSTSLSKDNVEECFRCKGVDGLNSLISALVRNAKAFGSQRRSNSLKFLIPSLPPTPKTEAAGSASGVAKDGLFVILTQNEAVVIRECMETIKRFCNFEHIKVNLLQTDQFFVNLRCILEIEIVNDKHMELVQVPPLSPSLNPVYSAEGCQLPTLTSAVASPAKSKLSICSDHSRSSKLSIDVGTLQVAPLLRQLSVHSTLFQMADSVLRVLLLCCQDAIWHSHLYRAGIVWRLLQYVLAFRRSTAPSGKKSRRSQMHDLMKSKDTEEGRRNTLAQLAAVALKRLSAASHKQQMAPLQVVDSTISVVPEGYEEETDEDDVSVDSENERLTSTEDISRIMNHYLRKHSVPNKRMSAASIQRESTWFQVCLDRIFGAKLMEKLRDSSHLSAAEEDEAIDEFLNTIAVDHHSPELIWNNNTRSELMGMLHNQLSEVQHRVRGASIYEQVSDFKYSQQEKEMKIGGLYVRLYNRDPYWSVSNPKLFLEELLKSTDERTSAFRNSFEIGGQSHMRRLLELQHNLLVQLDEVVEILQAICNVATYNRGLEDIIVGNGYVPLFTFLIRLPEPEEEYLDSYVTQFMYEEPQPAQEKKTGLMTKFAQMQTLGFKAFHILTGSAAAAERIVEDGHLLMALCEIIHAGKSWKVEQAFRVLANWVRRSVCLPILMSFGVFVFLFHVITSPSRHPDTLRAEAAMLIAASARDGTFGNLIIEFLFCLLPVEMARAAMDAPSTFIAFYDRLHEHPLLLWTEGIRAEVEAAVGTECGSILNRAIDANNTGFVWQIPASWNQSFADLKREIVVNDVFIRCLISTPTVQIDNRIGLFENMLQLLDRFFMVDPPVEHNADNLSEKDNRTIETLLSCVLTLFSVQDVPDAEREAQVTLVCTRIATWFMFVETNRVTVDTKTVILQIVSLLFDSPEGLTVVEHLPVVELTNQLLRKPILDVDVQVMMRILLLTVRKVKSLVSRVINLCLDLLFELVKLDQEPLKGCAEYVLAAISQDGNAGQILLARIAKSSTIPWSRLTEIEANVKNGSRVFVDYDFAFPYIPPNSTKPLPLTVLERKESAARSRTTSKASESEAIHTAGSEVRSRGVSFASQAEVLLLSDSPSRSRAQSKESLHSVKDSQIRSLTSTPLETDVKQTTSTTVTETSRSSITADMTSESDDVTHSKVIPRFHAESSQDAHNIKVRALSSDSTGTAAASSALASTVTVSARANRTTSFDSTRSDQSEKKHQPASQVTTESNRLVSSDVQHSQLASSSQEETDSSTRQSVNSIGFSVLSPGSCSIRSFGRASMEEMSLDCSGLGTPERKKTADSEQLSDSNLKSPTLSAAADPSEGSIVSGKTRSGKRDTRKSLQDQIDEKLAAVRRKADEEPTQVLAMAAQQLIAQVEAIAAESVETVVDAKLLKPISPERVTATTQQLKPVPMSPTPASPGRFDMLKPVLTDSPELAAAAAILSPSSNSAFGSTHPERLGSAFSPTRVAIQVAESKVSTPEHASKAGVRNRLRSSIDDTKAVLSPPPALKSPTAQAQPSAKVVEELGAAAAAVPSVKDRIAALRRATSKKAEPAT